jgi:hypothetical protein
MGVVRFWVCLTRKSLSKKVLRQQIALCPIFRKLMGYFLKMGVDIYARSCNNFGNDTGKDTGIATEIIALQDFSQDLTCARKAGQ